MIDTVSLWLETNSAEQALYSLINQKENIDCDTGEVTNLGKLRNLAVKVKGNGVSVSGSLAKFHNGDNYRIMGRLATERAIEELSDFLGLPMDRAKVYRLDAGAVLIMEHPVKHYWPMLGSCGRFERVEMRYELLYKTTRKALVLYDKQRDLRRRKEPIPQHLTGKHLLRYERRQYRRLANQYGRTEITANLLYDRDFFIELVDGWEEDYFAIDKAKRLTMPSLKELKSAREFDRALAAYVVKTMGEQAFLSMLEGHKRDLSKVQCSRMRTHIRDLARAKTLEETEEGIRELNLRIKQTANLYR